MISFLMISFLILSILTFYVLTPLWACSKIFKKDTELIRRQQSNNAKHITFWSMQ